MDFPSESSEIRRLMPIGWHLFKIQRYNYPDAHESPAVILADYGSIIGLQCVMIKPMSLSMKTIEKPLLKVMCHSKALKFSNCIIASWSTGYMVYWNIIEFWTNLIRNQYHFKHLLILVVALLLQNIPVPSKVDFTLPTIYSWSVSKNGVWTFFIFTKNQSSIWKGR